LGVHQRTCFNGTCGQPDLWAFDEQGGFISGFLGENEILSRERVKEIFRKKEYSYLEEKVNLLEVTDDSLLLKISFLLEYKNRMISIEEKEPIAVPFKDFKVEDWGDGVRKIADIE
jgi:hypothetical protein